MGRNPATGEEIEIPTVRKQVSKAAKEAKSPKRRPRDVPSKGLNNLYSKNIKEVSNGRN